MAPPHQENKETLLLRVLLPLIGAAVLLLAMYELAGPWGALAALGAMSFVFGLLA